MDSVTFGQSQDVPPVSSLHAKLPAAVLYLVYRRKSYVYIS